MDNSNANKKITKAQKQEAAREKARKIREDQIQKDKRKKIFIKLGTVFGVLVVAVIVGLTTILGGKGEYVPPLNFNADGGVAFKKGPTFINSEENSEKLPVEIILYLDYMCPSCKQFEINNGENIDKWVRDGIASIEYRPVALLDKMSAGTNYSSRSANAAACVVNQNPQNFPEFNSIIFANQPREQSSGLDNATLISYAEQAGAKDIDSCIKNGDFRGWTAERNAAFTRDGYSGTPTVIVNGKKWDMKTDFAAYVQSVTDGTELSKE